MSYEHFKKYPVSLLSKTVVEIFVQDVVPSLQFMIIPSLGTIEITLSSVTNSFLTR